VVNDKHRGCCSHATLHPNLSDLYHPFYVCTYVPTKLGYVDTFWYHTKFVNCWPVDKLTSFLGYLIYNSHSPHHCKQLFNNDRVHPTISSRRRQRFHLIWIFWAIQGWVLLWWYFKGSWNFPRIGRFENQESCCGKLNWEVFFFSLVTLPETNSSQMKRWYPKRKLDHLPTIHFQVLCHVSFREGIPC